MARTYADAVELTRGPMFTPREETVAKLAGQLHDVRLVHIRATASGKTECLFFATEITVLIDEAQTTYGEIDLWNSGLRIVLGFAQGLTILLTVSYGSPMSMQCVACNITPIRFGPSRLVGLKAADGVGLSVFFDQGEHDVVRRSFMASRIGIHPSVVETLFQISCGHAGISADLVIYVLKSDVGYAL